MAFQEVCSPKLIDEQRVEHAGHSLGSVFSRLVGDGGSIWFAQRVPAPLKRYAVEDDERRILHAKPHELQ